MDPPGAGGSHGSQWPSRTPARVCRYFQRGFCFYGEDCSYQHPRAPSLPVWAHHSSEPPASLPGHQLRRTRRNSLPTYLPSMAGGWSWSWAYWGWELDLGSLASHAEERNGSSRMSPILSPAEQASSHSQEPQAESAPAEALQAPTQSQDLELQGREASQDVVCGICMDKVWNKPRAERVFGILPNCAHAHCLRCLRTWRSNRHHLPLDIIKACPQCRVHSSYIIPHKFWVSQGARKEQLVRNFKARTGQIPCRFFLQRNGRCPFRSECIYLHQQPAEAPTPRPSWSLNMQLASRSEVRYPVLVLLASKPGELLFLPFCSLALRGRGSELRGFLRPGSS
ncbi:E3 ubiquitin-protein ligase makorin-2-like [Dipodomys merriami]|uniref:E3 ubiquitin-protein ligase makorin-2-like n=1 Tax=Dipodomys merriami TaxID=94247 RepID=UPI003855A894